ncbi:hypothetical protein [Gaetbulibacter saemankumensis]|uniref:hypothetical protein n=1 Tax=Gaetbulibacter saemankumensis TaxID=311208 RepID=UPI0004081A17|nr:hypothetical protein [Gaetbulibacter saemankumensis]
MKKVFITLTTLTLIFSSCKKQDPFKISKHHVGLLTDSTQVKDLSAIFKNDSVSKFIVGNSFSTSKTNIDILDKEGNKLLVLTPARALDSTSVIRNVQIADARYKTDKNISSLSTFKDISENYKISRIDNLINSVVVTVNEINASFTIDKKELPANLRFDMNMNIEATHIPDDAKLKYFFVNWNN